MPLLSSSIPNLVNGVSQQAPALRLSSQMEVQENAYSSIVEGLGKRPPTQHAKKLAATDISSALVHTINRDDIERYTVVVTNGDLFVYDMNGVAKTVAFPDGKTYLSTATPNTVMKALTVADFTFLLNTAKVVAMGAGLSTDPGTQALVFVKQGNYYTEYTVYIDGFEAAKYITSDTAVSDIRTTTIASALQGQLARTLGFTLTTATWVNGTLSLTQAGAFASYTHAVGDRIYITGGTGAIVCTRTIASKTNNDTIVLTQSISTGGVNLTAGDITSSTGWTVTLQDSTILVKKVSGVDFSIRASDSLGDRAMFAAKESVQRFTELPTVAPAGFTVEIKGDNSFAQDNYWVKFVPTNAAQTFDKGVWVETVEPGIPFTFDATTMPHVLVRETTGDFTFRKVVWGDRAVGSLLSAPDPSFVGGTINDIFFFRDRLGVLSDENVILTEAGDFFNFFPTTITTLLDSDPIDVAATHTRATALEYAVPFREELLLFSAQAQFVLTSGGSILTPTSVSIEQTTEFDASLRARPVGAGNNIYFGFPRGSFSGLREYFVQKDSDTKDASDTTAHVPKYIPGTITKLSATTTEDIVVALSSTDQDAIYVYKYYWLNDQKLQSSWSVFTFESGCKVLNADFIESTLWLVVQRADGHHLEKIQFEPGQVDSGSAFVTRLDRRLTEASTTITYNAVTDVTTWTLPYSITGTMRVTVRAGDAILREGSTISTLTAAGTTITASGDYRTSLVYIGQVYTMTVTFSEQVLREEARGGGQSQITAGRMQLRYFTVAFNDTGYFVSEVTPTGRSASTKAYTGLIPGVNGLGTVNLSSGEFRFPIFSQSTEVVIKLTSDSHLPCYFTGAEYEGFYHSRSQRA